MQRAFITLVLALFGALTAAALWYDGVWAIFEPLLTTWAGGQVFADLVIALVIVIGWMYQDAKALGRNPWPWILVTLAAGSFGPLFYLLTRKKPAS